MLGEFEYMLFLCLRKLKEMRVLKKLWVECGCRLRWLWSVLLLVG